MSDSKDRCGHAHHPGATCHCCPDSAWHQELALSRRNFLATAAVGGAVLSGLSWTSLAQGAEGELPMAPARQPLKVFPVLVWDHPQPAPMTSWRSWGGVHTPEVAAQALEPVPRDGCVQVRLEPALDRSQTWTRIAGDGMNFAAAFGGLLPASD